ncbi:putative translation initiation inhibitor [Trichoderma sp. SZMC 28013]
MPNSPKFSAYPGFGDHAFEQYGYSQAVRIGSRVEISGQGGWDPDSEDIVISADIKEEIDQAFRNVDLTLKHAGSKGISQAIQIKSYHTNLGDEVIGYMTENLKRWIPDHKPIWTAIGVTKLGLVGMRVEIEAVAHDPQEA